MDRNELLDKIEYERKCLVSAKRAYAEACTINRQLRFDMCEGIKFREKKIADLMKQYKSL